MIHLFAILVLSVLVVPVSPAQSLREAVDLMLSREPGRPSVHADVEAALRELRVPGGDLESGLEAGRSSGAGKADGEGIEVDAGEDMSRQLSASLRQFLCAGESGLNEARVARHRQAMQDYLEKGAVEVQTVELVRVYFDLLRMDRRIQEAKRRAGEIERLRREEGREGDGGGEKIESMPGAGGAGENDLLAPERLAQKEAEESFQRLVGKAPGGLIPPSLPAIPADRSGVDLSGNWNYLAAVEAVLAAEDGRPLAKRERLPGIFLDTSRTREVEDVALSGWDRQPGSLVTIPLEFARAEDGALTLRKEAWHVVKAMELQRAADVQRQYALSLLWRERQADLAAVHSLRVQTGILASVASDHEKQTGTGRGSLGDLTELQERLYQSRMRLIDSETRVLVSAFRILGVQGLCVEFIKEGRLPNRKSRGEEPPGDAGGALGATAGVGLEEAPGTQGGAEASRWRGSAAVAVVTGASGT